MTLVRLATDERVAAAFMAARAPRDNQVVVLQRNIRLYVHLIDQPCPKHGANIAAKEAASRDQALAGSVAQISVMAGFSPGIVAQSPMRQEAKQCS